MLILLKEPNYKSFYKEGKLKKFYEKINKSDEIIEYSHYLRNSNPMSHASAELIDKDSSSYDIDCNIKSLSKLIYKYLKSCTQP